MAVQSPPFGFVVISCTRHSGGGPDFGLRAPFLSIAIQGRPFGCHCLAFNGVLCVGGLYSPMEDISPLWGFLFLLWMSLCPSTGHVVYFLFPTCPVTFNNSLVIDLYASFILTLFFIITILFLYFLSFWDQGMYCTINISARSAMVWELLLTCSHTHVDLIEDVPAPPGICCRFFVQQYCPAPVLTCISILWKSSDERSVSNSLPLFLDTWVFFSY